MNHSKFTETPPTFKGVVWVRDYHMMMTRCDIDHLPKSTRLLPPLFLWAGQRSYVETIAWNEGELGDKGQFLIHMYICLIRCLVEGRNELKRKMYSLTTSKSAQNLFLSPSLSHYARYIQVRAQMYVRTCYRPIAQLELTSQ